MDTCAVRLFFLRALTWQIATLQGVCFAIATALFDRYSNHFSWGESAVSGALAGVFFGGFMGVLLRQLRKRSGVLVPGLSREQARDARVAVWRGPVPDDPLVHHVAQVWAAEALRRDERWRWPNRALFGALCVGCLVAAVWTGGPLWWFLAVLSAFVLVRTLRISRRLQQRLALLSPPPAAMEMSPRV
jgi:hypothetical protein